MKKIIVFLFVLRVVSPIAKAQLITFDWAVQASSNLGEKGTSIAVDEAGNTYICGHFAGTADFQPGIGVTGLTSYGEEDAFVLKLNAAGAMVWAIHLGGLGSDIAKDIALDANNNVYVTGYFEGTADFDPSFGTANMTAAGLNDLFIIKLNTNGSLIWNKQTATTALGNVKAYSIAVDASGHVLTTGLLQGTADFNPGTGTSLLVASSTEDCFVLKLTTDGAYEWAYSFGNGNVTAGGTSGQAIATDTEGNVYVGGAFSNTIDFNSSTVTNNLTSSGKTDAFILKLNAAGAFVWADKMGGLESDVLTSLAVSTAADVYCTGYFSSIEGDFDPGLNTVFLSSRGDDDVFIAKLNAQGDCLWTKSIGSIYSDQGASIANDRLGNIYIGGYYSYTTDFDPNIGSQTHASTGFKDGFILKLDASGNFSWKGGVNGSGNEQIHAICVNNTGNIYSTGYFNGVPDFDPGNGSYTLTGSTSSSDVFVQKLGQNLSLGVEDQQDFTSHLQVFPNPCTDELTFQFDKVYFAVDIKLISVTGQVLEEANYPSGDHFSMRLSNYSPGIYCVEIRSQQAVARHKIYKP